MKAVCVLLLVLGAAEAEKGSPVQKVIELLDEMKAKIESDLEAESAAMEEYLAFCDDETKEKANAMKTADATIENLNAIIEESKATISAKDDEVATLGTTISDKTTELGKVTSVREEENADFVAAEKELVKSVDECARAAAALEKGLSLMQMRGGNKAARKQMKKQLLAVKNAMQTILQAAWVEVSSAKKLQSLLQQSESSTDDESLSLHQPQAKQVAYESKSGVIVDMIKEMQGKAEEELSALRKKEMTATHEFKMLEQGLTNEITHSKEALGAATSAKAQAAEDQAKAEGDLVEVTKTKSADQAYSNELRGECETKATEWEARQKSAQGEMGALAKAKEILASGVKALVQVKSQTHRQGFDDAEEQENQDIRQKIAK